jgi:hypothetical protein
VGAPAGGLLGVVPGSVEEEPCAVTVVAEEVPMGSGKKQADDRNRARVLSWLAMGGLVVAAVVKELRVPAGERTWHGELAGVVPYDLRPPTVDRLRERFWAPENPRLIVPRVFGVGWTLNVGRLVALIRQRLATRS